MSTNHTLRTTDDEARELARSLIRSSPHATLATLSGAGHAHAGYPLASLVSVATDVDGAPVLLVSRLSGHTGNLLADPRCGVLFARTGKGDPLAHPRISVTGEARVIDRVSLDGHRIRRRFLARQPKAALYVDFPDFLFLKVEMRAASLNGGFGKAYELIPADLASDIAGAGGLIEAEAGIIAHMNEDHADALGLYATRLGKREPAAWRMISIDPDGFELIAPGELVRIPFAKPVQTAEAARAALIGLAKAARDG